MRHAPTALLSLLLLSSASAQEFKPAGRIEKERYVYGLPVTVKKGSRFSKLNLVPGGWQLWIVEVNGARPFLFGDRDQPNPTIVDKARSCTRVHDALSAEKSNLDLTIVVRRPGNAKGILVRITLQEWDQSFEYIWRKWMQDPRQIILPLASTDVGAEPFTARVDYTEAERLAEVAEYELRRKEEADERARTPLKLRESFRLTQRKMRLDAGLEKPEASDDAYLQSQRAKGANLLRQAEERLSKSDWFEAHRLARASSAFDSRSGTGVVDRVKAGIGLLDADDRGRLRSKVMAQAISESRDKNLVPRAEGAAFCLLLSDGDKEAAKILAQARRAAFGAPEISKPDLDRWIGVLGPLTDLASADIKEDVVYRVTGTVSKAGPFTLVESGKIKWVYEDKSNLKFADGETFTLVAMYDPPSKPPANLPEDLKSYPLLKLVAVR